MYNQEVVLDQMLYLQCRHNDFSLIMVEKERKEERRGRNKLYFRAIKNNDHVVARP